MTIRLTSWDLDGHSQIVVAEASGDSALQWHVIVSTVEFVEMSGTYPSRVYLFRPSVILEPNLSALPVYSFFGQILPESVFGAYNQNTLTGTNTSGLNISIVSG